MVTSKTITGSGGMLSGTSGRAGLTLRVKSGALTEPLQFRLLKPNIASLRRAVSRSGFRRYHTVAGAAVDASRTSGEAVDTFGSPVTVTIKLKLSSSMRGAIVVRYDPGSGKFTKVKSKRVKGGLVLETGKPVALAVLLPTS